EVYRRHGRHVVEQAWARLLRLHTGEEGSTPAARGSETEYDRSVVVQVGSYEIAVVLDRVEPVEVVIKERATALVGRRAQGGQRENGRSAPMRFVRHRLGHSASAQQDLRALFYTLAAEQSGGGGGAPVEMYAHNLSTGALEPLTLDARKRAKLTEQLHDALDGIRAGNFTPRPEPNSCQNCPFLLICPA